MKFIGLFFCATALFSQNVDCIQRYEDFLKFEKAYNVVKKVNVASAKADAIVDNYSTSANSVLESCPKVMSLDKQYVLRRELKKISYPSKRYRVEKVYEIRNRALTDRETVTVYKNGIIRPVR